MNDLFRDLHDPRLRDLVGDPIVSDPVHVQEAAQVLVPFPVLDEEQLTHEAWDAAFEAFPLHFDPAFVFMPHACCMDHGECVIKREAFVVAFLETMEGAQQVALSASEEHDIDLKVDPITAMAADHIRFGKPNRTRSHR